MEYLKNSINKNFLLYAIIFISIIIKFIISLSFHPTTFTWPDEKDYITIVQNVEIKNEYYINMLGQYKYYFFRPPGYVFFLFFFRLFSKSLVFLKIVQIIISSISIYLLYLIINAIFDNRLAVNLSLVLASFHPLAIYFPTVILSETLVIMLILLLLLIYMNNKSTFVTNLLFGLLSGYLILIKPDYIILILCILASMKIRKAVIIVVFMLLSISPWLYRNYRIYNSPTWISSNSGYMFWLGNRGDVIKDGFRHPINESTEIPNEAINAGNFNELEVQKRLFTITVRGMKTKDLLPLVWNKFMFMWILPVRTSTIATFIRNIYVLVESGYYYLILILGLFGLYKASNINNHHIVLFRKFILFLFICILINGLIFLPRARYRFPFEFIFIIPAGFGMFSILNSNRTMQNILNKL